MVFGGADIVHGVIFAGLSIACAATEGGHTYIDEYCNVKVAHIKLLCKRLQSLDCMQGACTTISRSISRKLAHLHAAWPACAQGQQSIKWFERADEVVLAVIANLMDVPNLPARARVVAVMLARLTGSALPLGQDRAAETALAFSVNYMSNLPED